MHQLLHVWWNIVKALQKIQFTGIGVGEVGWLVMLPMVGGGRILKTQRGSKNYDDYGMLISWSQKNPKNPKKLKEFPKISKKKITKEHQKSPKNPKYPKNT